MHPQHHCKIRWSIFSDNIKKRLFYIPTAYHKTEQKQILLIHEYGDLLEYRCPQLHHIAQKHDASLLELYGRLGCQPKNKFGVDKIY